MSLRRGLSLFVLTLAGLTLGAGVSLILLTSYLHRATVDMENGLHSVRVAEELQIDLLTYARAADAGERRVLERDLRAKLREARQYVNASEEDQALTEAGRFLELHFAATEQLGVEPHDGNLQKGFEALRRFVEINVGQADASLRESAKWDEIGDRIGIGVAAALLIGTFGMVLWIRAVAFRPVFEIRTVMRNFAAGDKAARVTLDGPDELRRIAAQFNEMADALARQHHNQAAFLAAIAHDLRNPLSALKVSADLLSNQALTPDKVSNLMGVIKRQVLSLDRMVGDLLDSSKIESGHLELRLEECDARIIARDSFDLFRSASKAHHFTLNLPGAAVPLQCDRLRIEQVLNNLVSNALKYSPGGGKVVLSLTTSENEARFEVSDEGMGISKDELPYIFEPFRRVRTGREEIPGVGLGLSVAQRIVRAHGGRIHVDSQIGSGTRFCVHLPVASSRQISA